MKRLKESLLLILCFTTIVVTTACTNKYNLVSTNYNISSTVETPTDVTIINSDTQLKEMTQGDSTVLGFTYEDNLIKITWCLNNYWYNFTLVNKTAQSIKINWDEIAYVFPNGITDRMIHKGISYDNLATPQVASSIPRKATYEDYLIPISNMSPSGYSNIFYLLSTNLNDTIAIQKQIGTTTTIQLPLVFQDVQYNYVFNFKINNLDYSTFQKEEYSSSKSAGLIIGVSIIILLLTGRITDIIAA